ncbi:hypothetical protein B0H14DRAFT_3685117 [Mycena olivaceomarginata]|nr:hypothetical protein B0H14DRAFT_3685117 [Mycena olivaceomarginata]
MRGTARCGLRPTAVHPDLTALTRRERRVRLPQPRSTVQPGARAALAPPPLLLLFSPTFSPALASLYPPPSPFAAHQSPFATANPSRHPLASPACSPYTHRRHRRPTPRTPCPRAAPPAVARRVAGAVPGAAAAGAGADAAPADAHVKVLAERAVPRALGAPAVAVAGYWLHRWGMGTCSTTHRASATRTPGATRYPSRSRRRRMCTGARVPRATGKLGSTTGARAGVHAPLLFAPSPWPELNTDSSTSISANIISLSPSAVGTSLNGTGADKSNACGAPLASLLNSGHSDDEEILPTLNLATRRSWLGL